MQASIQLKDDDSIEGVTQSGHQVLMDRSPEVGGQNLGARPMEMLLLSFDFAKIASGVFGYPD